MTENNRIEYKRELTDGLTMKAEGDDAGVIFKGELNLAGATMKAVLKQYSVTFEVGCGGQYV